MAYRSIQNLVLDPRFTHGVVNYVGGESAGPETLMFAGWVTETVGDSSDVVAAFLLEDGTVTTCEQMSRVYRASDANRGVRVVLERLTPYGQPADTRH